MAHENMRVSLTALNSEIEIMLDRLDDIAKLGDTDKHDAAVRQIEGQRDRIMEELDRILAEKREAMHAALDRDAS